MGEVNYEPVIRDMVWSYSRIKAFEDCPYRWYLKYIRKLKGKDMFFANYGTFMHKLIELYYLGEKTPKQLCEMYLQDFKSQVTGFAPNKKIFVNYFTNGLSYLRNFEPFPYTPLGVEKQVKFEVDGIPFTGYIDFLGEKDGKLFVIDNKSRNLKPRSGREAPTKTDKELDSYLKQLYLYSIPVEEEYGQAPQSLCFNCFRTPVFIEEPFNKEAYTESKQWLSEKVKEISLETDFKPDMEFFKCKHLCEMQDYCEYYELSQKKEVIRLRAEDITRIESEAGIVASLVYHPEFSFYSENLLPNHFSNTENRYIYIAICNLAQRGIKRIDSYSIAESLKSHEGTAQLADALTIEQLNDFIDNSENLARHTVEDYKLCVDNVMNAAFRRDTLQSLKKCEALCFKESVKDIEQQIYNALDDVMMEFSSNSEVPSYKDLIDDCWEEIKGRQSTGYAGIPFKFSALNDYATIERGELFIFGAEQKQGKSMMLLNCAVDLLKQDYAVLYLDSELNTRLFTARILAHLSGVEYKRLTSGAYSKEEEKLILDAKEWLKTRKFTHIYIPTFDQHNIYTAVKRVEHTQGLDVLIVDYFKGKGEGDAFDSYQELGRFVDMVKNQICGDMNIAGIGAAQATITGKLADSAKIARNASTIAMISDKTPDEIEADGAECGNKKLRVTVNRNGMQMAQGEYIDLLFDGNHILYEQAKQHIPQTPF